MAQDDDDTWQGLGKLDMSALSGLGPTLLGSMPGTPMQGLASGLSAQGAVPFPGIDPRLTDVTRNPQTPAYRTANGTLIQMNKAAPDTILPWGDGLGRLIKFADGTGLGTVKISGGTEAKGHTPNSVHPDNKAIDVSGHNDLDDETVRQAALAAGYTHGMYEIGPDGDHWHLQVGPDNIRSAEDYDLEKKPMQVKVYTPKPIPPIGWGQKKIPPLPTNTGTLQPIPPLPAVPGGD